MKFGKTLSDTDTGKNGTHQAGIVIPKSNGELLNFFPALENNPYKNPDCWITCEDPEGEKWKMRYIWYNGKLHGRSTRNEYRLTHSTSFMKLWNAETGDEIVFESTSHPLFYKIKIIKNNNGVDNTNDVIILRGWRKIY